MPRQPSVPKLCHHKASNKAVVRLNGRDHYLGLYGTPEAKAAYDRLIAEWLATGRRSPENAAAASNGKPAAISINEVLLAYWRYAEQYYRTPAGEPSSEIASLRKALRPVADLYGLTPAVEFGPRALAAVRQRMLDADLCRNLINKRIDRVKRVFKWAASEELVPVSVYESLRTLAGLRRGRTDARESKPVKPVEPGHVTATLPHLNPHVRAMVELQRFTGMRPGEVCGMTLAEVDRSGELWLYRPAQHKTAHHGRERVIPIGPKARAALTAFLLRDGPPPAGFAHINLNDPDQRDARLVMADAYQEAGRARDAVLLRDTTRAAVLVAGCVVDPTAKSFNPAEAREERFRGMRASRKSKVPPSQKNRKKANPKRSPAAQYHPESYAHHVEKAAQRAGVPHWHPNQLRHLFATEVRRLHGLEAAQVLLGHSRADVTQVYAERDLQLAARVASEIG
jgi:integrase